jgi:Transketolase, N-terminal subunit
MRPNARHSATPETDAPPFDPAAARQRCLRYRKRILDISQQVTALHVAPAFSCTEIVDAIYHGLMRWDTPGRSPDVFVMSKGHGCLVQYVILEEMGVLQPDDLALYCRPEGRLGAHPDVETPGIEASTGSLGHGMGMAVGMAYAEKLQGRDGRVFVVLSDGECQSGSTWEAAMMAANLGLDNLVAFIDMNDFSGLERMSEAHPAFHPLLEKFHAFGWDGAEVEGHDARQIHEAVTARLFEAAPFVVVCRTVKGKGVSYMEHVPIWHYRSPSAAEYEQALAELAEVGG